MVTGLGVVSGREVLIRADDSSVKGGVWYTLTPRKLARLLDIALENQLPVLHLCDSGGAFLEELSGVYIEGGRVFRNQCLLSKAGVPQVAMVFGHCTAGGAYIPALCDYSIIVRGTGGVFLGGPPLVKAATGEEHTADEIGRRAIYTPRYPARSTIQPTTRPMPSLFAAKSLRSSSPRRKATCPNAMPSHPTTTPTKCWASSRPTTGCSLTSANSLPASSTAAASTSTNPLMAPR